MRYVISMLLLAGLCVFVMADDSPVTKDSQRVQLEVRPGDRSPGEGLTEMLVPGYDYKVYIGDEVALSNTDIASAEATTLEGENAVYITFTESGAKKLADLTEKQFDKVVGIFFNGSLISAPLIRGHLLGGQVIIAQNLSDEDVVDIVATFTSGGLGSAEF